MFKITDKDYTLVENENSPLHGVKFLRGEWKDVIVVYGQVSIKETPELDAATLAFNFNVQDPADFTVDELEKDEVFKNYLGDVLQYIISDSLNYANETNQSIIGIGNDESTTDTHTEPPSQ